MGRNRSKVTFEHRELDVRVRGLKPHVERRVDAIMHIGAAEASAYAKANARWHDDTGAARSGLFALANKRALGSYEIILAHAVSYGIWLEVRWHGRYAIIEQTLHSVGQSTMSRLNKVLS